MNRKEAAELSPFIKAFGEGRIIESSSITDVSKSWREVTDFPIGMIKNFKFRIKPEPKFRPFKDAEECWTEMQKHHPFGWVKSKENGYYSFITMLNYRFRLNGYDGWRFDDTIKKFTFADGTPFGVKEDSKYE